MKALVGVALHSAASTSGTHFCLDSGAGAAAETSGSHVGVLGPPSVQGSPGP